jgi:DNA polymerase II large subunit
MNDAHANNSGSTTTARAEQALDSVGYRIGFLAGTTTRRLEHAVSTVHVQSHSQANKAPQSEDREASSHFTSDESVQRALVRAEELMHRAEQRLGQWSAFLSHQSQRLTARTREELEDFWVEAQHLRQTSRRS